jgi:hypothetical protein
MLCLSSSEGFAATMQGNKPGQLLLPRPKRAWSYAGGSIEIVAKRVVGAGWTGQDMPMPIG